MSFALFQQQEPYFSASREKQIDLAGSWAEERIADYTLLHRNKPGGEKRIK